MFQRAKVNLILIFTRQLENGESKKATVTLQNLRPDITAAEVNRLASAFRTLIKHQLSEVQVAEYKYVL